MYDIGVVQSEAPWGDQYMLGADVLTTMELIAALNIPRVRLLVAWEGVEKDKGTYTWGNVDRAVAYALQNGLKPLFCVSEPKPTGWGVTANDYATLCSLLVTRYGVTGFTYNGVNYAPITSGCDVEIWNEPNLGGYWTNCNPTTYTQYLNAAYTAIHAAQTNAVVITAGLFCGIGTGGSLTRDAVEFLQGIYDAGGLFDAVGAHPYSVQHGWTPCMPSLTGDSFVREQLMRNLMNSKADTAKNIWWTEWGFPSVGNGTPAEQLTWMQAQWQIYISLVAAGGRGPAFSYNLRDDVKNPSASNAYGIYQFNFTPKPVEAFFASINPGAPTVFSGAGQLSMTALQLLPANLSGAGQLSMTAQAVYSVHANFSGSGQYSLEEYGRPVANFGGSGALSATVLQSNTETAPFTGSGQLSMVATVGHLVNANFSGSGQLAAGMSEQALFQYTFTGSTKPTSLFTDFGAGYVVSGGVADNAAPTHTNGTYYSGGIYKTPTYSANHSVQITRASGVAYGDRSPMCVVRSDATGANMVTCVSRWGGSMSTEIITFTAGVPSVVASSTDELQAGDTMELVADGNVYTVWINGNPTGCTWTDSLGAYSGAANKYVGFGFQHRWANGEYDAPGITGTWYAQDVRPVAIPAFLNANFGGSGQLSCVAREAAIPVNANFTGSGALSAIATEEDQANFSGSGQLSATAVQSYSDTASLSGSGALSATGVMVQYLRPASLTGSGSLSATAIRGLFENLTGSGTLSATLAVVLLPALAGSGALSALAVAVQFLSMGLSGIGALTAAAMAVAPATAAFTGSGALSAAVIGSGQATLTGSGALTMTAVQSFSVTANLSGSGALTTLATQEDFASLSGSGALSATAVQVYADTAPFAGSGALTCAVSVIATATAAFTGSGALSAIATEEDQANFSGSGQLSATAVQSFSVAANFSGSGAYSAAASGPFSASASLSGSGALSATAVASYAVTANFAGTGTLSMTITVVPAVVNTPIRTAFASTSSPTTGTLSNYTPLVGDIIAVWLRAGSGSAALNSTLPSGWVAPSGLTPPTTSDLTEFLVYHVVTSAEQTAGTKAWTLSSLFTAAQTGAAIALAVRGANQSNPIDAVGTTSNNTATTANQLAGVTPNDNNSLVASGIGSDGTGTYSAAPPGWTLEVQNSSGQAVTAVLLYNSLSQAGVAIGATTITAGSSTKYVSITAAFAGAG